MLEKVEAQYPASAKFTHLQGWVKLEAFVRADGTVGEIRVVQGLPLGCTEAAQKALVRQRFIPAILEGRPVDLCCVTVEYHFH
jgi:outer membrane biosynthesis protein TonB